MFRIIKYAANSGMEFGDPGCLYAPWSWASGTTFLSHSPPEVDVSENVHLQGQVGGEWQEAELSGQRLTQTFSAHCRKALLVTVDAILVCEDGRVL